MISLEKSYVGSLNGGPCSNLGNCKCRLILKRVFEDVINNLGNQIILYYLGEPKRNDICLHKRHTEEDIEKRRSFED